MNEFQIISKLGEGAYSVVYKVKRLVDSNIYALKKVKLLNLSDKEKQNALNEVRILASLKSKNVISYKECFFDETDNFLGIVMEFADKGDLYQKICELKKLQIAFEETDIWRILIQMVKGLKSLHDLKILHRDLKSANIFLFSDGTAKLGDLNVSKVAKKGLGYTQTGTPYYASPEVWKDKPYDSKSDIWSLGCVLYEMVMLKPPFRAEDMEGLYNKVIKGQFPKISEKFSADLAEVVRLLIQVNPELRPNCDQILKNPIVIKRLEYFKTLNVVVEEEIKEDNHLLQTIRIPKNLLYLTDKLPTSNYEKYNNDKRNQNQSFSNKRISNNENLPNINSQSLRKVKPKKKEIEGKSISPTRGKLQNEDTNLPSEEAINSKETIVKESKPIDNNIKIKKLEMPKLNYNSIENDHSRLLSLENSNRSNDKRKNNVLVNNSINNDIMLLPHIRGKNEMSLSPSNRGSKYDKENLLVEYNKKIEDSRNMAYNEKKLLKLIQNSSSDLNNNHNNNSNQESYIPYVIHNRNNALLNKYNKYKVEKSYSPKGNQKYIKSNDYRKVGKSNKLPIIQNTRKNNGININ